jgi:hypothetical protein
MPSVVTVTTRSVTPKKTTTAEPTTDEPTVKESNIKQNAAATNEAAEYSEAWTRMQDSMTPKPPEKLITRTMLHHRVKWDGKQETFAIPGGLRVVPMGIRTTIHMHVRF